MIFFLKQYNLKEQNYCIESSKICFSENILRNLYDDIFFLYDAHGFPLLPLLQFYYFELITVNYRTGVGLVVMSMALYLGDPQFESVCSKECASASIN